MALKQDMARQIQAQVEVWQAQIAAHRERMAQAGQEAKAKSEKAIAQLQDNAEQAQKLLRQVQDANEAAWKDMQQASLQSLERLQKGWADALKRFG
jgi:DNA anti-recombination protein RmuC